MVVGPGGVTHAVRANGLEQLRLFGCIAFFLFIGVITDQYDESDYEVERVWWMAEICL